MTESELNKDKPVTVVVEELLWKNPNLTNEQLFTMLLRVSGVKECDYKLKKFLLMCIDWAREDFNKIQGTLN